MYSPSAFRPDTFFEPGLDEFRLDPSKMAYWRLGDSIYGVNMNVYIYTLYIHVFQDDSTPFFM